jgi:hypothetical protein
MKIRLTKKLRNAATRYLDLQSRKTHPFGETDNAGRWYPDDSKNCCKGIRSPTRSWPWSLMLHCRTMVHVAQDTGYELTTLRAAVRRIEGEVEQCFNDEVAKQQAQPSTTYPAP